MATQDAAGQQALRVVHGDTLQPLLSMRCVQRPPPPLQTGKCHPAGSTALDADFLVWLACAPRRRLAPGHRFVALKVLPLPCTSNPTTTTTSTSNGTAAHAAPGAPPLGPDPPPAASASTAPGSGGTKHFIVLSSFLLIDGAPSAADSAQPPAAAAAAAAAPPQACQALLSFFELMVQRTPAGGASAAASAAEQEEGAAAAAADGVRYSLRLHGALPMPDVVTCLEGVAAAVPRGREGGGGGGGRPMLVAAYGHGAFPARLMLRWPSLRDDGMGTCFVPVLLYAGVRVLDVLVDDVGCEGPRAARRLLAAAAAAPEDGGGGAGASLLGAGGTAGWAGARPAPGLLFDGGVGGAAGGAGEGPGAGGAMEEDGDDGAMEEDEEDEEAWAEDMMDEVRRCEERLGGAASLCFGVCGRGRIGWTSQGRARAARERPLALDERPGMT